MRANALPVNDLAARGIALMRHAVQVRLASRAGGVAVGPKVPLSM
jgi:hypothetical protein